MSAPAIALMLATVIIIWGGLAVSVTALVVRGRREDTEEKTAAFAQAHAHMRQEPDRS